MTRKMAPATAPDAIAGTALVPIRGHETAPAGLAGTRGRIVQDETTTLITGRDYVTRDGAVEADEIYYVEGLGSQLDGPWLGEADKVAWRDERTGYECIMMRATHGGYLSGYVGIPANHPLWGWEHGAVPSEFGIEVHGGLSYSRICEDGPMPVPRITIDARRICHVPRGQSRYEETKQATAYRVTDAHAWWFGFDCDHIYDVVPIRDRHERHRFLAAETGAEYRDDAYVVREIRNLAAQLQAIAHSAPRPLRDGPPLPAIGLDPSAGACDAKR